MPAKSDKQRKLMALASKHPEKVHKKNKGVTRMSKADLRDFASTPESDLPERIGYRKRLRQVTEE